MRIFENLTLDEERALYAARDALVVNCRFEGPKDGESALKECQDITAERCFFALRYPLWHVTNGVLCDCHMTDTCRAAMWYDKNLTLTDCRLLGIKAMRECLDMTLDRCEIVSPEFGWKCRDIVMHDCELTGEYPFFDSEDMTISRLRLKGKYSFQYAKNTVIRDSVLDTKDAFWHCENMTVYDSEVRGEYLGWYSKGLKLVRCRISGTQPLCYCEGLVLEDCEMENADLAFERSDVRATVKGHIDSVKNPISGRIEADDIGEVILDETLPAGANCEIIQRDR